MKINKTILSLFALLLILNSCTGESDERPIHIKLEGIWNLQSIEVDNTSTNNVISDSIKFEFYNMEVAKGTLKVTQNNGSSPQLKSMNNNFSIDADGFLFTLDGNIGNLPYEWRYSLKGDNLENLTLSVKKSAKTIAYVLLKE